MEPRVDRKQTQMTIKNFERQLKKIHKDFAVLPNPKIDQLAGVYFRGVFLFTVPNHNIFPEKREDYGVDLPNGVHVKHRNSTEALAIAAIKLKQMAEDPDYADAMFGRGEYSDAALKEDSKPNPSGIILPSWGSHS